MVKQISEVKELEEEINNCTSFLVLYFTATWCGPCKAIAPFIEKLDKNKEIINVTFLKIDVDESEELCETYDITSMPTFVFLKQPNTECDRLIGANKEELSNKIKNLFTKDIKKEEEEEKEVVEENETNYLEGYNFDENNLSNF